MNEKSIDERNIRQKKELELIEAIKRRRINEAFGIEEKEEDNQVKKKNFLKLILRIMVFSLIFTIILLIIGLFVYLINEYTEYQSYKKNNKEIIAFGELYKKEQKMKEDEIKELSNITLDNIRNLPEDKKELMFNLIPSGNPLKREMFITSEFGVRTHPVSGVKREHHGVDLRVDIGDDVIAPAIGKVVFAGQQGGYGNVVKIEHVYGFQTVYAHLSKIEVKVGDIVGKGKKIAEGGNSGVSTGPHLHYEVRYNGTPIDPVNFLNWNKQNFDIVFKNERSVPWEYFLTIMGKN